MLPNNKTLIIWFLASYEDKFFLKNEDIYQMKTAQVNKKKSNFWIYMNVSLNAIRDASYYTKYQ